MVWYVVVRARMLCAAALPHHGRWTLTGGERVTGRGGGLSVAPVSRTAHLPHWTAGCGIEVTEVRYSCSYLTLPDSQTPRLPDSQTPRVPGSLAVWQSGSRAVGQSGSRAVEKSAPKLKTEIELGPGRVASGASARASRRQAMSASL